MPSFISDNMVLQCDKNFVIWGWAKIKSYVEVFILDCKVIVKSDENGKWFANFSPISSSSNPFDIKIISGKEEIKIKNVLCGEVWLCSGQSNMDVPLGGDLSINAIVEDAENQIKNANYPLIRFFTVKQDFSENVEENCEGNWQICYSQTAAKISAVAFFFAQKLQNQFSKVPIGLIISSLGGSMIEPWCNRDVFNELLIDLEKINYDKSLGVNKPTALFNAMIAPFYLLKFKGFLWYQGEANVKNAREYFFIFPMMVKCWREIFKQTENPFYYVQIAPFAYEKDINSAIMRDIQRQCLGIIPNSGMICVNEINSIKNIHPKQKKEVGERLALLALKNQYKQKIIANGPMYKKIEINKNRIRIYFTDIGNGLILFSNEIKNFEIAGKDGHFYSANATIENDTILVFSDKVLNPKQIRYAWKNESLSEFGNSALLPVSTFYSILENQ